MGGFSAAAAMLLAGETGMLKEFLPLLPGAIALSNPLMAKEWEKTVRGVPFLWTNADGYCYFSFETQMLMSRALAAIADEGHIDADAVRSWLPPPEKLLYIAEHEWFMTQGPAAGVGHPAILCATVQTRLGDWDASTAVAEGLLTMPIDSDGVGFGTRC